VQNKGLSNVEKKMEILKNWS